jgi:L,D-transpeptidase catalytic domain
MWPFALASADPPPPPDRFEAWLAADWPPADGFGAPFTRSARCGPGCWRSDEGVALAAAAGIVREVGPTWVVTEHLYYDDDRHTVSLRWDGVEPSVWVGEVVTRGQPLGSGSQVVVTGADDAFFADHARTVVPQREPRLVIVDRELHQARLYQDGAALRTVEIGLGQADGDKVQRGDNRTPRGAYRVVERSTGPFGGKWADFYGGYWAKLSYPGPWDADRGVQQGWITEAVAAEIDRAYWAGEVPPQNTRLGGGIGFHGWIAEWSDEGSRGMSFGCVVLHLSDVAEVYEHLALGTLVVIR